MPTNSDKAVFHKKTHWPDLLSDTQDRLPFYKAKKLFLFCYFAHRIRLVLFLMVLMQTKRQLIQTKLKIGLPIPFTVPFTLLQKENRNKKIGEKKTNYKCYRNEKNIIKYLQT